MTRLLCRAVAAIAAVAAAGSAQAQVYDLADDFSFASNPNGQWQYGYSTSNSLAPGQFQLDTASDTSSPVGFWHPSVGAAGYYPYVAQNPTSVTQTDPTNSWAVRAGEVAMEASNTGQFGLIRLLIPQAGDYRVDASFEGIHFNLSTTDVHVLLNATSLFDDMIDGYGGDPNFHPVVGSHPSTSFSAVVHAQAGDLITFAVGYGPNQTHFNDTTGLFAVVRPVPEVPALPAVITAATAAAAVLSVRRARQRLRHQPDSGPEPCACLGRV